MLHIHRAERADGLVGMLGTLLGEPLDDPMQAEVVSVPTRGIERWLAQQLSCRLGASAGRPDGVCANISFPFPGSLIGGALAAASGIDGDTDPWAPERAVWPLLEVVDASLGQPWLAPLALHLRNSTPAGDTRRFAAVRHVADLYDRYSVHRPEMLRAWVAGDDLDGSGQPLGDDSSWQPQLWRALRGRIAVESPAERLVASCGRLRDQPELAGLPDRLSLFGLTRLPSSYLDVLDALAAERDIHLFLLHPSPALWDRVLGAARPLAAATGRRRGQDPTAAAVRHPLLASWGQDAREMQLVLGGAGLDHHQPSAADGPTLLGRIQADIRADRRPAGIPLPNAEDGRVVLDPTDRSIQVHACHGRARQVEVLRDTILHLLAGDPTLELRDVIVMCPDIETYAPLIGATFGAADPDDDEPAGAAPGPPALHVRLADRSLRQTNPVLGVVAELLDLRHARLTGSQVLDLAGRQPVRTRFRLDDDDLTRLAEWIGATGIRWGLDAEHRAPFQLDRLDANTWRAGLDRALLGVAMADERQRRFGGVVPLDDVDSGDIELAGRWAELLDRLAAALEALDRPQPLEGWAAALAEAADALTATSERDAWQRGELQRLLDELTDAASTDGAVSQVLLHPADISALLGDRLHGRPTRANFRTGHLTVCTLVPMRSVPHRVVCLLGLDDGVFPRHVERDGDDLIAADPHLGDRDARSEDRQLLLDALMAATDHLVITYAGRDERRNLPRPPAVPVGELLDTIDRTATFADSPARSRVVIHHPLQPFDARNFIPGELVAGRSWSFSRVNLDGARAAAGERRPARPFLDHPLPALETTTVGLEDLERFLRHPVRSFLRVRLGVSLYERDDEVEDSMPVELDALEQWAVAERFLAARLDGVAQADFVAAERARGLLPPGVLADPFLEVIAPSVERLVEAGATPIPPASLDVNAVLATGVAVVGTVAGVHGDVLRAISYSRLGPTHRLLAWVRLLALTAAWPERHFEAVTIGRARAGARGAVVTRVRIPPLGDSPEGRRTAACAHLERVIDLFRRGTGQPLPLYARTSAAWAEARRAGKDPEASAAARWNTDYKVAGENGDPEHVLVLGRDVGFDALVAAGGPPAPDEAGEGWEATEPTRLGRYARRLWDPLLAVEEVTDL